MDLGTANEQQAFIHEDKRKVAIKTALLRLKQRNEGYLDSLQRNIKWRKNIQWIVVQQRSILAKQTNKTIALLSFLIITLLFQPLPEDSSKYDDTQITMCYNKFNKEQMFQEHALYNLTLLYDSKIKKDVNWNNLQMTARSTIRALHIAKICSREDKRCFQREVTNRVLDKDRFKGKQFNFEDAYKIAIEDMSPISQITYG